MCGAPGFGSAVPRCSSHSCTLPRVARVLCAAGPSGLGSEARQYGEVVLARLSVVVAFATAGRRGRAMRRAWALVVVVVAVSGGAAVLANRDLPQQEAAKGQTEGQRLQPRHQDDDENARMNDRTAGWVAAAYGLLQALQCEAQRWTTEEECRAAQRVPQWEVQVWATPAGRGRFVARLPDGSLARRGGHGGVLLVDPFPAASWGHPLLLLLVADNTSQIHCTRTAGHWLGESLSLSPAGRHKGR